MMINIGLCICYRHQISNKQIGVYIKITNLQYTKGVYVSFKTHRKCLVEVLLKVLLFVLVKPNISFYKLSTEIPNINIEAVYVSHQ